jgi:hypothetical protein
MFASGMETMKTMEESVDESLTPILSPKVNDDPLEIFQQSCITLAWPVLSSATW